MHCRKLRKRRSMLPKLYKKRVHEKSFQVGDLVWKMILPLGSQNVKYGKWSPSWEGPFKVIRIVPGNSYFVESLLEGQSLPKALNGKYLKQFHPSIWQGT
jgi:hypothetical protein